MAEDEIKVETGDRYVRVETAGKHARAYFDGVAYMRDFNTNDAAKWSSQRLFDRLKKTPPELWVETLDKWVGNTLSGRIPRPELTKSVTFKVGDHLHAMMVAAAKDSKLTLSDWLREACREKLGGE